MAYLTCTPINYKSKLLTESLSTMGRQFWDGLKSMFDTDIYFDDDYAFKKYMDNKRKYFDENHMITPQLKAKLQSWVRQIPGALILPKSEMEQLLSATSTEQRSEYYIDDNGYAYGGSYEYNERMETSIQRRARNSNARNSMTHATCSYMLDMGGGKCALLFFTFDDEEIDVCQVITSNKYNKGGMTNFSAVKIPQWNTVRREEYKK